MKKLLVISDTHIPLVARDLPQKIYKYLEKADFLIHAGDFISKEFLERLRGNFNLIGVAGNMDSFEITQILPSKRLFKVEDVKIGVIHGKGAPQRLLDLCLREFEDSKPQIIIFGHSHTPLNEYKEGILFFNPGSPTDKIYAPYNSFGIIEIDGKEISAKIKKV